MCYFFDSQTHNINILLGILTSLELLPPIQQIKQLTAVNLIKRNINVKRRVILVPELKNILSS